MYPPSFETYLPLLLSTFIRSRPAKLGLTSCRLLTQEPTSPFAATSWMDSNYGNHLEEGYYSPWLVMIDILLFAIPTRYAMNAHTEAPSCLHIPRSLPDPSNVSAPVPGKLNVTSTEVFDYNNFGYGSVMFLLRAKLVTQTLPLRSIWNQSTVTDTTFGAFLNYDTGAGHTVYDSDFTNTPYRESSHHLHELPPPDAEARRQVGSRAGTEASKARRRGQQPPRFLCKVRGCTSQGFTSRHNYQCSWYRPVPIHQSFLN